MTACQSCGRTFDDPYPTQWGAVRDDDRHVEANTLAKLIELVTA